MSSLSTRGRERERERGGNLSLHKPLSLSGHHGNNMEKVVCETRTEGSPIFANVDYSFGRRSLGREKKKSFLQYKCYRGNHRTGSLVGWVRL